MCFSDLSGNLDESISKISVAAIINFGRIDFATFTNWQASRVVANKAAFH